MKNVEKATLQLKNNCLTEAELVRGKNGRAIFGDWHQVREVENCSWREVKKACKSED